jgi:bilirubin oxidase
VFGNAMLVNGKTWPLLEVEPRRYRLRFLNGCNGRFLILRLDSGLSFWQIGAEGGFLPAPVQLGELLMGPAERADVIVDFTGMQGQTIRLLNFGPDEPFGGGVPGVDFDPANPETTGQVMEFRVTLPLSGEDTSTPPDQLGSLPAPPKPGPTDKTRQVSLNEAGSTFPGFDGPVAALLGTMNGGTPTPLGWADPITEQVAVGDVEEWAMHNFTEDAHPIHIHEIQFEVVNRESIMSGEVFGPESWETGLKDTVVAYPEQITRVKAHYDRAGLFVWHCHIVEHEDNEMMRPYRIG